MTTLLAKQSPLPRVSPRNARFFRQSSTGALASLALAALLASGCPGSPSGDEPDLTAGSPADAASLPPSLDGALPPIDAAPTTDGPIDAALSVDLVSPCGNGQLDPGEQCDDGNRDDTDSCLSTCRLPLPLTETVGPISLQPSPMRPIVNLYLVSPGGDLQGELAFDQLGTPNSAGALLSYDPYPSSEHIATVRVFDPDEKLVHWHAQLQAPGSSVPEVRPSPSEPPPASFRFESGAMRGYRISLARAGVYQIRISTNSLKGAVQLKLPSGVGWGFAIPSGTMLWPLCGHGCASPAASFYAWAPRHPTLPLLLDLVMSGGTVPLTRVGEPSPMVPLTVGTARRFVVPPGNDEGEVWRVDLPEMMPSTTRVTLQASGMPFILTNSEQTARALRASVVRAVGGDGRQTLVSHPFQRDILELLPQLAALAGTDATSDTLNTTATLAATVQAPACLGSTSAPLSADDVWRRSDLFHSYDNPLRAVRFYLSRAEVSSTGTISYGTSNSHTRRALEFGGTSHFAGAVGLHLLERQTCQEQTECTGGGSCVNGACSTPFDPATARWDVLRGVRYQVRDSAQYLSAFTGLGLPSLAAAQLARAATWSHPCNPWGPTTVGGTIRHPELLVRAAMQGLSDLLTFGEDERQLSIGDTDPYPGSIAFQLPQFTRAFAETAPALEQYLASQGPTQAALGKRVRTAWAEGLRRALDRNAPAYLVSTINQSSHLLLALEEFAHGAAGLPFAPLYRQEARAFAKRFAQAAGAAGWLPEDSGPDASYSGISHWHMGQYLALSAQDPEGVDTTLRAALARSYGFLSYFSTDEPDGQRTSSTSFSHRTTTGFDREQYLGALGVVEDVPEVATWTSWMFPSTGPRLESARTSLASLANLFLNGDLGAPPRQSLGGSGDITLGLDSARRVTPALLPAQRAATQRFEELLPAASSGKAPEALAVGRPGYYASLYFGKPRGTLNQNQAQYWPILRSTDAAVTREDVAPVQTQSDPFVQYRTLTPMVGGGLSLLSTPSFGSAVVAAGWSPLVHHGLVAELSDGGVFRRYWEDYEQVSTTRPALAAVGSCAAQFADASHRTLPAGFSVYGRLEGRSGRTELWPDGIDPGLCYARHYSFLDDRIEVRVIVRRLAPAATTVKRLFESVPVPTCTRAVCNSTSTPGASRNRKAAGTTLVTTVGTNAIVQLRNASGTGAGVDFVFPASSSLAVKPHGLRDLYYGEELQLGRIEVELALPTTVGSETTLDYAIVPTQ